MKDIQLWASILEAGRLVSVSVRGAGPCVRLPLPRVRGTTDPRIPLWGPLHPKVQHLASRAYGLPERHGFVLFGDSGRARWVPPGNLPALEADFAALAAEAEALSQMAARRWGRIRQWVALAAARKAEEAGLAPDWRARWEEALEEAFKKGPPRLELRMLQARVSDPVQVALEARRLRAAAAEAEALEAREEAARALARDLLAFGREVRDQVWRETRQLLRELGQGLAQTLEKGGRPPALARRGQAAAARVAAIRKKIEALGPRLAELARQDPDAGLVEAVRDALDGLEQALRAAQTGAQMTRALQEALQGLREAGLLPQARRFWVVCPGCGLLDVNALLPPLRCPRCDRGEGVAVLENLEEDTDESPDE